jgi:transcriptional regulator with XRE-family HTH domain
MSEDILIKFGNKIRKERLKRGYSQEDFAELVGVHRTYIGMIERAEKNITLRSIEKIAKALNVSISKLIEIDKL